MLFLNGINCGFQGSNFEANEKVNLSRSEDNLRVQEMVTRRAVMCKDTRSNVIKTQYFSWKLLFLHQMHATLRWYKVGKLKFNKTFLWGWERFISAKKCAVNRVTCVILFVHRNDSWAALPIWHHRQQSQYDVIFIRFQLSA